VVWRFRQCVTSPAPPAPSLIQFLFPVPRQAAAVKPGHAAPGQPQRAGAPAGADAVARSETLSRLKESVVSGPAAREPGKPQDDKVKYVGSKTFYLRDGVWFDSTHKEGMQARTIVYLSPEYFDLLTKKTELGQYFALGKEVVVCLDGVAYRITAKSVRP
jgi:hypothetical protein